MAWANFGVADITIRNLLLDLKAFIWSRELS